MYFYFQFYSESYSEEFFVIRIMFLELCAIIMSTAIFVKFSVLSKNFAKIFEVRKKLFARIFLLLIISFQSISNVNEKLHRKHVMLLIIVNLRDQTTFNVWLNVKASIKDWSK